MTRSTTLVLVVASALAMPAAASAQGRSFPLDTPEGLKLHNVTAEPATLSGKRGVKVTLAADAEKPPAGQFEVNQIALIEGVEFGSGVIEAEIAGAPASGAGEGARGFVGIAFRAQPDMKTYDAFYLRPANGRAEDQERRNRSTQYISHPEWTWSRLRKETPGRYESYVDLQPGVWTKIKIEVRGDRARLYVHDQPQPTLIVNDVKSGATAKGGIALWVGAGAVGHFRNLRVTPDSEKR